MPDINTAYSIKFQGDFTLRVQQMKSRLRETVRDEPDFMDGAMGYFDRIGARQAMTEITTRHGDTPINGTNYDRRRIILRTFNDGDMVDKKDIERTLKNPTNRIVESMALLWERTIDDFVIAGASGTAISVGAVDTSPTQQGTSVPFPSSQIIAASAAGLTLTKVLAAMQLLDTNEVGEDRTAVVSAEEITQMLNTTQTTNQYYLAIEQLRDGKIDYFGRARWVRSQRLWYDTGAPSGSPPVSPSGATYRKCLMYAKRGVGLSPPTAANCMVYQRPDKQMNWQIYMESSIASTRIEDEAVVQINCDI